MITTTIDLLRHGEVQGGTRYRGRTDDPLSPLGRRQMRRQTAGHSWDIVISSPLNRCQAFAAQLSRRHRLPLLIESCWQEIDFGDWEGKTADQIDRQSPLALRHFYEDPENNPPPNGESHAAFAHRVENGWRNLLSTYPGRHLLIVTHAGVIRTLFSQWLNLSVRDSFHIQIGHACLSRFICYHDHNTDFMQLCFHKPL